MSKKKKQNSRRPKGFVGKPKPVPLAKRVLVFIFGMLSIMLGAFLLAQPDQSVEHLQYSIAVLFLVLGLFLVLVSLFSAYDRVNKMYWQLIDQTVVAIFRAIVSKVFG